MKLDEKKTGQLMRLLERLNKGEEPEKVRREAQEFLESIGPADLSFAEQKLLDSGLKPGDLRNLCSVHMEMVKDELEKLRKSLQEGHPVHTMVCEHDEILGFLDELEKVNNGIRKKEKFEECGEEVKKLRHIAHHLLEAEAHHKREEDVLFPELEKRGVTGPPQIMRMEHEDMRKRKKELKELAEKAGETEFSEFRKRLDAASKFIVLALRDHIFKENNILYPTAVQVIQDKGVWDEMLKECNKIGYCCFTPKNEKTGAE